VFHVLFAAPTKVSHMATGQPHHVPHTTCLPRQQLERKCDRPRAVALLSNNRKGVRALPGNEWITQLCAMAALCFSAAASADVVAVQCTIDEYRSSFAPRPDSFTILVDTEARTVSTYYGQMPLKMTRKQLVGGGPVSDGWRSNVVIDRNTGRLSAGTDKVDGRKHSYTDLRGTCILPPALQGPKYQAPAATTSTP
jgi:hypothetical protein